MRGASAVEEILKSQPDAKIKVFVVWEPILATDFVAPTTSALRRISDARAVQFWDEGQVLARRMAQDARPPQPKPECCDSDGILWDLAAMYPAGSKWEERMPPATLFDGPVYQIREEIQSSLKMVPANH